MKRRPKKRSRMYSFAALYTRVTLVYFRSQQRATKSDILSFSVCRIISWTQKDVTVFLKTLDLSEHSTAFTDRKVTGQVLIGLDEQNLQELGVSRAKDRKQLLKAVRALSSSPGKPRMAVIFHAMTIIHCISKIPPPFILSIRS